VLFPVSFSAGEGRYSRGSGAVGGGDIKMPTAPAAVDGLGRFLAGSDNVDHVDVLPLHRLGAHKYGTLAIPFPRHGLIALSARCGHKWSTEQWGGSGQNCLSCQRTPIWGPICPPCTLRL
jgi:hypothetical protein